MAHPGQKKEGRQLRELATLAILKENMVLFVISYSLDPAGAANVAREIKFFYSPPIQHSQIWVWQTTKESVPFR